MTAGISFNNGMQVNMDGGGLAFQGPGDVGVRTDTGTLVVAENIQTAALQSNSAVFDELTVEPPAGVQGAGFDRFNQAPDVVRIDGDVIRLATRIQINELDIGTNALEITRLTGEVNDNLFNIETNRQDIDAHGILLGEHNLAISELESESPPPPRPPTPPPPPPVCAPLWSQVNSEMQGLGYSRYSNCGTSCRPPLYPCPEAHGTRVCLGPSSANPVTYIVRNANTLYCETRTANFYTSQYCRKDFTGNPCK